MSATALVGVLAATLAGAEVATPPEIAARSGLLTPEQRDFMRSKKAEALVPNRAEMYRRWASKTPEQVKAYVEAMMQVVEDNKFHPEKDMASIPLDTTVPGFNSWKTLRPQVLEPKREPGPFTLSRYAQGRGGIPTFFNRPVAITPEDLMAGAVDIAVDQMSTERSMEHIREDVRKIAATGALPFIVGGDHSLEYSDVAGLADVHG